MATTKVVHVRLTDTRRQLLHAILDWQAEMGYPPSARELARAMGVSSPSTVHAHLKILRDQQAVSWHPGCPRTLTVTRSGRAALAGAHDMAYNRA